MTQNTGIEIYRSQDRKIELNVKLENETVWLTREQMSVLFGRDQSVISCHISNIYEEGELDKKSTIAKFANVLSKRKRSYILYLNV